MGTSRKLMPHATGQGDGDVPPGQPRGQRTQVSIVLSAEDRGQLLWAVAVLRQLLSGNAVDFAAWQRIAAVLDVVFGWEFPPVALPPEGKAEA